MRRNLVLILAALLGLWWSYPETPAQAAEQGTVSGTATVILRPQPSLLRVRLEISSQARTLEATLAKLKARREAALLKLRTLKAENDSIQVGRPSLLREHPDATVTYPGAVGSGYAVPEPSVPGVADPDSPVESPPSAAPGAEPGRAPRLPRPRGAPGGEPSVPPTVPFPGPGILLPPQLGPGAEPAGPLPDGPPPQFFVVCWLQADWRLEGQTPEELLLTAEKLRQRILAADLGGGEQPLPGPAEREAPGRAAAGVGVGVARPARSAFNPDGPRDFPPRPVLLPDAISPSEPPGPLSCPYFCYVAKLAGAERQAALAEGFAKARAQAAELAAAAGYKLGGVAELSREISGAAHPDFNPLGTSREELLARERAKLRYAFGLAPRDLAMPGQFSPPATPPAVGHDDREATAEECDALHFEVRVDARFRLQ